jgi:plastocyanin
VSTGADPGKAPWEPSGRLFVSAVIALRLAAPVAAATKIVDVGPNGLLTFFDEESGTDTTTVTVGDTVEWVWQSSGHSTTRPESPEAWDSNVQAAPFSFTHQFMTPGTYPYHCIPHQFLGMVGTVIVMPAAGSTTTLPPSGPTTTTSSTTTTTITLPADIVARFDSIEERLTALTAAVDGAQLATRPRTHLTRQVQRAAQGTTHARDLLMLGRRRPAKGALRQAMRSLAAFETRVRLFTQRRRLAATTGALLLGTVDSIRNDLATLVHAV